MSFYATTKDWAVVAKNTYDYLGGKSAGKGSLMRTIPVALAHEACVLYNRIAHRLLQRENLQETIQHEIQGTMYHGILENKPNSVPDGFVVNTLSWSLYILLHTESFEEAVRKAVNEGYDADTTGAVVGDLAGLYYGFDAIPTRWVDTLLKKQEINTIAEQLHALRTNN